MDDLILSSRPELVSPALLHQEIREFASEFKYWIPADLAPAIQAWARQNLRPDPHGSGEFGDSYETTSLYFDTAEFDVLRRAGSYGRSKYRIRRYNLGTAVFVERKLKTGNLVSKRRSAICIRDLDRLNASTAKREWAASWFQRRIEARALSPVCQISYVRMARMADLGFGPARLTLDQDLRAVPVSRIAYVSGTGSPLAPGYAILELKFRYQMPHPFQQLLDKFQLQSQPLSKYRLAASVPGCVAGLEASL